MKNCMSFFNISDKKTTEMNLKRYPVKESRSSLNKAKRSSGEGTSTADTHACRCCSASNDLATVAGNGAVLHAQHKHPNNGTALFPRCRRIRTSDLV